MYRPDICRKRLKILHIGLAEDEKLITVVGNRQTEILDQTGIGYHNRTIQRRKKRTRTL